MTKLFEAAVERARALQPRLQDDLARLIDLYAENDRASYPMSPEEEETFRQAFGEIDRGERASDERVHATWARFGL